MQMHWQEAIINVLLLWMLTAPHEFAHAWVATGWVTTRRGCRAA